MGNGDPNKLIDIMKMTGAKFIKKYIDPEQFKADQQRGLAPSPTNIKLFAGYAEHVTIDKLSTKIVNPKNMRDEDGKLTTFFLNYVDELKDQVSKLEETRAEIVEIGKLKRRINVLLGNMVDLYIGGIGTSDRQSLTDSVEDAVLNCRSAAIDGVGNGASFDGFKTTDTIYRLHIARLKALAEEGQTPTKYDQVKADVAGIIWYAYWLNVARVYAPYFEDNSEALQFAIKMIRENGTAFNAITEQYDGTVLTSIKTEPAILDSIARIISVLFDTNQFLVPSPEFNIYTEGDLIVNGVKTSEQVEEDDNKALEELFKMQDSMVDPNFKPDDKPKLGYAFNW